MLKSIILGIVQGLAEFLPISSSGHLVLAERLLALNQPGMLFDVMLHFGTLVAVFVIFRKRLLNLILGICRRNPEDLHYAGYIILASIPTAIIGIGFKDRIESLFENPQVVCVMLLVTGVLLFCTKFSKAPGSEESKASSMNWKRALVVGTVQGIACIPGISRSGSTISSMLFLGVNRKYAGEFSFLMSIPAVGGAALLELKDWLSCRGAQSAECMNSGNMDLALLAGIVAAFISGVMALKWLLSFVQKGKLHYFAWYVWAAGILGLIFIR
ncbi:MAG: undecaprenyl-diphosphatase UppP [Fibrobacter sp.]|jgi:undecaprenyl-diphosphatase|nr:undecaprenyl-diphosphatase UppP [Fibrobacter sp.]